MDAANNVLKSKSSPFTINCALAKPGSLLIHVFVPTALSVAQLKNVVDAFQEATAAGGIVADGHRAVTYRAPSAVTVRSSVGCYSPSNEDRLFGDEEWFMARCTQRARDSLESCFPPRTGEAGHDHDANLT